MRLIDPKTFRSELKPTGTIRTAYDLNNDPYLFEATGTEAKRFIDFLNADDDGRLLVLPCKVGDTVWVIGEGRVVECYIDEARLYNDNNVAYLVSCDHDCDGCPFFSWHENYSGGWSCNGEYGDNCILSADFGKTVFLTREEAEKALEGKNNA